MFLGLLKEEERDTYLHGFRLGTDVHGLVGDIVKRLEGMDFSLAFFYVMFLITIGSRISCLRQDSGMTREGKSSPGFRDDERGEVFVRIPG